jgi:hypothetical protein
MELMLAIAQTLMFILTFINKKLLVLKVFFTSVKNTFNTVNYKEQFLIKLASTKNVTFNVSCIKINLYLIVGKQRTNIY